MLGGAQPLRGTIRVPGDKSISHRALLFAALANGRSTITHLATGDDVAATRTALTQLGVKIRSGNGATVVFGSGFDGLARAGRRDRLRQLRDDDADPRRRARGPAVPRRCSPATRRCASGRWRVSSNHSARWVRISTAVTTAGALRSSIRGGAFARATTRRSTVASAQVKSALILAGLQAEGPTEVVSPAPTRDHTERMLAALGAPVTVDGLTVRVEAGPIETFGLRRAR